LFRIMARPLLLLAFVLAALTGCRDALVDPGPSGTPVAPPDPAPSGLSMYIKGPSEVALGASASYRAELVTGAEDYRWFLSGTGGGVSNDLSHSRWFTMVATQAGDVYVTFLAYDADGALIARNEKHVVISVPS
jgi:hypothetical protein